MGRYFTSIPPVAPGAQAQVTEATLRVGVIVMTLLATPAFAVLAIVAVISPDVLTAVMLEYLPVGNGGAVMLEQAPLF